MELREPADKLRQEAEDRGLNNRLENIFNEEHHQLMAELAEEDHKLRVAPGYVYRLQNEQKALHYECHTSPDRDKNK